MANVGTARNVIGIIGNVISVILFLSPAPTFFNIMKRKSIQNFKPDPYIASLVSCALWVFYGLPFIKPDTILVLTTNAIGVCIELIFVCIFIIYSPGRLRMKILFAVLVEVLFMVAVILITFFCFHSIDARGRFVGIIAIIFSILMYAAPLTVMGMVIKTKSVKYMPFFLALMNLANGLIWTVYSSLQLDINVLIPNSIGALSGLAQLTLYVIYYRTTNWNEEEPEAVSEVQLSRIE